MDQGDFSQKEIDRKDGPTEEEQKNLVNALEIEDVYLRWKYLKN